MLELFLDITKILYNSMEEMGSEMVLNIKRTLNNYALLLLIDH
jgi:hypothetical protein